MIDLINKISNFPTIMVEKIFNMVFNKKPKTVKKSNELEVVNGPVKDGKLTTVFESEPKRGTNMPGHRNPPPPPPKDRRSPYYNSGVSGTAGKYGTSGTSGAAGRSGTSRNSYSIIDKFSDFLS